MAAPELNTTPALAVRGLSKRFGSLAVARDVDFALPCGARYALIGPNGAGKTTLINLIAGMLAPDAGRIFLGGQEITARGPAERVKLGLVRTFQVTSLFPRLTPLEAVALAVCERRNISGHWWRRLVDFDAAVEEAWEILASLALAEVFHRPIRELAYGQQRMLEIALALAARPRVILLDEPAAGVPREESSALLAAISALPEAITVLFIEHDMSLVFRFASRILVMVGGRILAEGTPAEIGDNPEVRAVYLGAKSRG